MIVAIYIFNSFIHVVGHIFSGIYSTGFGGISKVMEIIIEEQLPSCLGDGNSEAENIFLVVDMSNSNEEECETWFRMMNTTKCSNNYI